MVASHSAYETHLYHKTKKRACRNWNPFVLWNTKEHLLNIFTQFQVVASSTELYDFVGSEVNILA